MRSLVPGPFRGGLSLALFALNTALWTIPLLLSHFLKVALPNRGWRSFWMGIQDGIGTAWISFNNWNLGLTNPVRWRVQGAGTLDPDRWAESLGRDLWYLVIANHRSWVDILVLQKVFNRRIPFLKFFLKKELIWVPFLGLAWWALDYPFLKRSASAARDLESIRSAAERFKIRPVSVMVFVEGTRFTPKKHVEQRSPHNHLLKPKPGGMAFLLTEMRNELHSILDVTIAYPEGTPTFWGFLCGRTREIRVQIRAIPLEPWLGEDFRTDKAYRRRFITWQRELWEEKDQDLAELLA